MAKRGPKGPSKYQAKFHPNDYIRQSKNGKNLTQIALAWDIDRDTIYEWSNKYPKFSDAVKKGRAFAEAWYTNLGQLAMLGQAMVGDKKIKMDVGLFVWMTKNLFKWSDRNQSEISGQVQVHTFVDLMKDLRQKRTEEK